MEREEFWSRLRIGQRMEKTMALCIREDKG